jgi:hypothetical protein
MHPLYEVQIDMEPEHLKTIYVGPNNVVPLVCPQCGNTKNMNVEKFKGRGAPLTLRCKCKTATKVFLEFRKAYRKKVDLKGSYIKSNEEDQLGRIAVLNISRRGIGFKTLAKHDLSQGDEIKINFTLDDERRSEIETRGIVRSTNGDYVGCEFIDQENLSGDLGFYLMP